MRARLHDLNHVHVAAALPSGPQFEPPGGYPGPYASEGIYTYGFGNNGELNSGGAFLFSIVDQLAVPARLSQGAMRA